MNRKVILGALIACTALLVWMFLTLRPVREPAGPDAKEKALQEKRAPAQLAQTETEGAPTARVAEAAATVVPSNEAASEAAPAAKIDKKARDVVHLIVQDCFGAPVANADIKMVGLRTQREPGSHWAWPGEPSIGKTASDGTATLWHPVWVNSDDQTGELTFTVTHPDFVTKTVDSFAIGPEPRVVVLERGAFVIVSGWIDSPRERIVDVLPHVSWEVELTPDSWQPIRDGRLSTANIPVGRHAIYLSNESEKHGLRYSEVTYFVLEPDEHEELHLQLLPAITLEGRLEDEVPRPVLNGTVLVNLQVGDRSWGEPESESGSRVTMLREFQAPIRADGTFTVEGLPPGDGQIIALCDGWASERIAEVSDEELDDPSTVQGGRFQWTAFRAADATRIEQRVDPAAPGIFVLKMEPTSALATTLRGPDGQPVEGAVLTCWPNVRWLSGYSSSYDLGHPRSATSDREGKLIVTNMPWGSLWYGVEHADLELPLSDGDRSRMAELEPGTTLPVVLDLVAKDKE